MWANGVLQINGNSPAITRADGDTAAPGLGPETAVAVLIRLALRNGEQRLRKNEQGAREGESGAVHRMRTAARRLRSELRLYRDLIDGDWGQALAEELRWLGRMLGGVRDWDVMRQRLRESAGDLVDALEPLFATLARRQQEGLTALRAALDDGRYRRLLDQLSEFAENPRLRDEAQEPSGAIVPPLVRARWKRLQAAGRALDLDDSDEEFHKVRKRAKRARYSAEAVAQALDSHACEDALRFARRATEVQDVLGEHQDAIVACREIARIAAEHPDQGPFNLAVGRLLERQAAAADAARTRYFTAWQKLDRKKNGRWMKQ